MTADARTVDDRIALIQAAASLTRFTSSALCPMDVANAIDTVMTRCNELMAAALPSVDLAPLKNPQCDEWGWGPRHPELSQWWARKHRAEASLVPDVNGRLVMLRDGVSRDEIPELAGFLMAIYAASDPTELAKRMACDCFPDEEEADPTHESWCATNDRPVTA